MQQSFIYKLKFTSTRGNNSPASTFVVKSDPIRGIIGPDRFAKLLQEGNSKGGFFLESWRTPIRFKRNA